MIRTDLEFLKYVDVLQQKHSDFFIQESYGPKENILKQDKRYQVLYIIKSGITKCYLSDENGKDFIQEFLGGGMEFGELEVFSGGMSFCSIEAITQVEVYKISHNHYKELLANDVVFNGLILKSMATKIGYKAPRHSFQQSYSIEENILRMHKIFPDFERVLSKKDIANYMGVTLRSLNRALQQLSKGK